MTEDILIIIPSFNNLTIKGVESLDRCINSIYVAIEHFKIHFPNIDVRIAWVDDASTDGTFEYIKRVLPRDEVQSRVEQLNVNSHQGYCRNHGAKLFDSEYIMFCDSDDEWYPQHITQCYEAITTKDSHNRFICAVSTLVDTDPELGVHPDWIPRISGTIPFNKMIRRNVWDFIEGFPTHDVFKKVGCEDQVFMQLINHFFFPLMIGVPTVKYHNYKGSFFDKQLPKFRLSPYLMYLYKEPGLEEKVDLYQLVDNIQHEKIEYLKKKLTFLDLNRSFEKYCCRFV